MNWREPPRHPDPLGMFIAGFLVGLAVTYFGLKAMGWLP